MAATEKELRQKELEDKAYQQSHFNQDAKLAFLYKRREFDSIYDEKLAAVQAAYKWGGDVSNAMSEILHLISPLLVGGQFVTRDQQIVLAQLEEAITAKYRTFDADTRANLPNAFDFYLVMDACATDKQFEKIKDNEGEITNLLFMKFGAYKSDVAYDRSYKEFFNKSLQDITNGGMVYVPPGDKHQWSHNASWLLGHFHKGTEFIIKSDITLNAKNDRRNEFGVL